MNESGKGVNISRPPAKPGESKAFAKPRLLLLFLFIAGSFLLYLPVINRFFVSDDFKVLKRVCLDHVILIKRFFRPLSDLSIYLNYRIAGLEPAVFNAFNILIHGINAFLLYRISFYFARSWDTRSGISFALLSSLLFLTYPFHNEGIVWLLGRGASMAALFCLLGLVFYYEIKNPSVGLLLISLCYFIGLSAYESAIVFPLIMVLLMIRENEKAARTVRYFLVLVLTLIMHLILRFFVAGTLTGSYGEAFLESGFIRYLSNIPKVAGRLFLPPSTNSRMLIVLLFLLSVALTVLILKNHRIIRKHFIGKDIRLLLSQLAISCLIPVISGVSTQTSETDRMLYFPSVFLCMAVSYIPLFLIGNSKIKIISILFLLSYNVFFLERNNLNWKSASSVTYAILTTPLSEPDGSRNFFINIPNEIDGAYVFRLGFEDALLLFGKDSTKLIPVNYLTRTVSEKLPHRIRPVYLRDTLFIPPETKLIPDSDGRILIFVREKLKAMSDIRDNLYFWNKGRLEPIHFPVR
jgi:hypothetical protein